MQDLIEQIVNRIPTLTESEKKYAGRANYCMVIIKYYSVYASDAQNAANLTRAFNEIAFQKITLVNLSSVGKNPIPSELEALKLSPHTKFFVAAGNEGKNLDLLENTLYPFGYGLKNIYSVGNLTEYGAIANNSNYGNKVSFWEVGENVISTLPNGKIGYMSGTSMSCAVKTGKYIYEHYY